MKCDILFTNCNLFSSSFRLFFHGFFAISGKYITRIGIGNPPDTITADKTIDLENRFVIPGLIDVHMHIESSMLTPQAYAYEAIRHGVTTVVSEPHEIANVFGVRGIEAMMKAGENSPIDIYYGIPSCVPSTSSELETAGCEIGVAEVEELLKYEDIKCLGEVMNTKSVLSEPDGKTNRLIRAFHEKAPALPLEGHVPRIVGDDLAEYMMSGIDSDHTEHPLSELIDRWLNGFCVQLQEKTVQPDIIAYLNEHELFNNTCLVTDDVMADEMVEVGILDHVLRKALSYGMDLKDAVYCCTFTPASRMKLFDRGELRPGKLADFVILEDDEQFEILSTYKEGICVYTKGDEPVSTVATDAFPEDFWDSVKCSSLYESNFVIHTDREGLVSVRAVKVDPTKTHTEEVELVLEAKDGELNFEDSTACQMAVFERHGINGNVGQGLVIGTTLKRGAIATTYSHDSHNLCVLGTNKADMASAANLVIGMHGGIAVVENGNTVAAAALPIAGILTDKTCQQFAEDISKVTAAMKDMGYTHVDPIMSFCTLALPVSPQLKITDFGYVDVSKQEILPIEI
ncbi:MAG: adenine deaminase [Oscillospiraceae bacterium]|nr:adenine deaminase [Oscillospiraceae bacterium]MBR0452196.1 adenine deaminase [Oscillospiraceae bacterium]